MMYRAKTIWKKTCKTAGVAMLLLLLVGGSIGLPSPAAAASRNPSYCDAGIERLTNANIQDKVPVIMVHGFNGKSSDWGSTNRQSDFAGVVNRIPGVAVAHLFNYNTNVWVDHKNSGPKLAKTIDCVSQLSLRSGGKGKVIVVGYSMGGLVARDALSHRSTDGQRAIADQVGQVITIGTPHIGTTLWIGGQLVPVPLWGAFTTGSPELARLPHFPAQTVVHTIAGDVTRVYLDKWGREISREQPYDDELVTTLSAHAEYTIDASRGGGSKTISCEKRYRRLTSFAQPVIALKNAPCEHTRLTNAPNNGVREDTVEAIKKYVASLSSATLTIGDLTTTYDSRWIGVDYGASGPGQDGSATDTTNSAPCTNCSEVPAPTVHAFVQIYSYADWCSGSIASCAVGSQQVVDTAPAVSIGGRTPDYSARYLDSGYDGTSLAWCFEAEKVCVHYRRATDTPQLALSSALLDVFRTATWAN